MITHHFFSKGPVPQWAYTSMIFIQSVWSLAPKYYLLYAFQMMNLEYRIFFKVICMTLTSITWLFHVHWYIYYFKTPEIYNLFYRQAIDAQSNLNKKGQKASTNFAHLKVSDANYSEKSSTFGYLYSESLLLTSSTLVGTQLFCKSEWKCQENTINDQLRKVQF